MTGDIDLSLYLVPLVVCKHEDLSPQNQSYMLERYAGVAFYVDDNSRIATCKHIVDSLEENEEIFGLNMSTGKIGKVLNIQTHKSCDFATGVFPMAGYRRFTLDNTAFGPGNDVQAMGFINNGKSGNDINVQARLHKGYIVCASNDPATKDSNSTLEVSFPSHKGFSGTPLISVHGQRIVGMLFSNAESSIETYKYVDVSEQGHEYAEGIYRIVELGLAHSNRDILNFLSDMN